MRRRPAARPAVQGEPAARHPLTFIIDGAARDRLPRHRARKDMLLPALRGVQRLQEFQRPVRQGDDVLAAHFHPAAGDFPKRLLEVDLAPFRPGPLARPDRRQDDEFERHRGQLRARPKLGDGGPDRVGVLGRQECWMVRLRIAFPALGRDLREAGPLVLGPPAVFARIVEQGLDAGLRPSGGVDQVRIDQRHDGELDLVEAEVGDGQARDGLDVARGEASPAFERACAPLALLLVDVGLGGLADGLFARFLRRAAGLLGPGLLARFKRVDAVADHRL